MSDKHARIYLLLISLLLISPLLGEAVLRAGIAMDIKAIKNRDLYASPFQDGYYALKYMWDYPDHIREQGNPRWHPLLGWTTVPHTPDNPLGVVAQGVDAIQNDKPKTVFYGDSFVRGHSDHKNTLPALIQKDFPEKAVVDMSIGAFGLDQIYLMMRESRAIASGQTVLIGILLNDLERTLLKIKRARKPYFELGADGELELKGVPIKKKENDFIQSLFPKSFFLSLLKKRFLPMNRPAATGPLQRRLLEKTASLCEESAEICIFVVFYRRTELESTTKQETFLKEFFDSTGRTYIDTKPVLLKAAEQEKLPLAAFYKDGNGHHNDLGNQKIAEALVRFLQEGKSVE